MEAGLVVKKLLLIACLIPTFSLSEQVSSFKFKGLNNNENSVIIMPEEAQDLLNVDVTPGGASVKKRAGYGLYKALATNQPIKGIYHGFDSTGNDVQIVGSSTSLYGIVAGGTPTQLISSATLNSTWDCADSQAFFYCVNSNRNAYIKTNGATMTWYPTPLGTMVASTPDRMIVAGVSGSPNTLFVSQSNAFTNFTVGINTLDPFNEVIASPGSKLTHITWGCGKLLWWKDQSMGMMDFDDQFNVQIKTISDGIGTFDNTSAIDPGGNVWFHGQDGHTYKYDCSFISKESIDITPNTQVTGARISNSWTQATQADWQASTLLPATNLSTVLSVGDVALSSYSRTESSSTTWTSGTASNVTVSTAYFRMSTNNTGTMNDPSFETASFGTNFTGTGNVGVVSPTYSAASCVLSAQGAGNAFLLVGPGETAGASQCNPTSTVKVLDAVTGAVLASQNEPVINSCSWSSDSVSSSADIGKRVKFKFNFSHDDCAGTQTIDSATTINSYIFGGTLSFYTTCAANRGSPQQLACFFDSVTGGSSTITTGSFTSQVFDTGRSSMTVQIQSNYTVNTSTPYFALDTSPDNTVYTRVLTSSGTSAAAQRYVKYITTFSITSVDNALTSVASVGVIGISTGGIVLSQVHNSPNFTSWGTLGASAQSSTHTFYVRASGTFFTVQSSTPGWFVNTNGNLISATTGVYIQFRDDITGVSPSSPPFLNDVTLNWFEGNASDQAYMLYFDNAIWESVPFGVGQSTNNYIFKMDLINAAWTQYSFGTGGMLIQANKLYFGDTTLGNVFQYGTGTSDNGSAISAYWKSKDFSGQDPFLQDQLNKLDLFCKKDAGTTLTSTYTTDTAVSNAYSVSLSTSAAVVQNRKLLPPGKLGYNFNIKLSDNSVSSAWECFGYRMDYTPLSYRPSL